jgi:N-acetylglutamate synthase-like GNAT family acetyltransferase
VSRLEIVAAPRLDDVRRLLDGAGLPSADVDEALLEHFLAGRMEGALAGIVGLEICGRDALVRSLVVDHDARRTGVGRALVAEAERRAGTLGMDTLYLLTTTAADYFRALGYNDCPRAAAPAAVRASREFSSLCPADAAFLCKRLKSA